MSAVEAVVVEPEKGGRSALATVLGSVGIANVTAVGLADEELEKVDGILADLVLVDASPGNPAGTAVVRRLRDSVVMRNPFAVAMVTTFEATEPVARAAALAGGDTLLPKPVSTAQMTARLRQMIVARRPFQITGSYIGPDLGPLSKGAGPGGTLMEVPNTLRHKADGSWRSMDLLGEIGHARAAVAAERIRRNAFEIAWNLELAHTPTRDGLDHVVLRRVPPLLEDLLRQVAPERRAATAELVAGLRDYIMGAKDREAEFIRALPGLRTIALALMSLFSPGVDQGTLRKSVHDALPKGMPVRAPS